RNPDRAANRTLCGRGAGGGSGRGDGSHAARPLHCRGDDRRRPLLCTPFHGDATRLAPSHCATARTRSGHTVKRASPLADTVAVLRSWLGGASDSTRCGHHPLAYTKVRTTFTSRY